MLYPNRNRPSRPGAERKPISPDAKKRFVWVLVMTFALLFIYYGAPEINAKLTIPVMITYMVAFAGLLVAYLIYNRGFLYKNVTPDMLPPEWSEDKKLAFLEDNRNRAEKSRWMMVLIIPFIVVFMVEAVYLFVWNGWLSRLLQG